MISRERLFCNLDAFPSLSLYGQEQQALVCPTSRNDIWCQCRSTIAYQWGKTRRSKRDFFLKRDCVTKAYVGLSRPAGGRLMISSACHASVGGGAMKGSQLGCMVLIPMLETDSG